MEYLVLVIYLFVEEYFQNNRDGWDGYISAANLRIFKYFIVPM